jgi:O-Antigen ligase
VVRAFSLHVRSITCRLFTILLFLVVSLPTGSILGVNLKVIAFVVFWAAFVLYVMTNRNAFSHADVFLLLAVMASLCFWSLIGILNGQADTSQIFYHVRELGSAILIAWLSIFFIRKGLIRSERLIGTIVYGMFVVSAVKVALVAGSLFFDFSPIQTIQSVFGETSTVAGSIDFNLIRLEFSGDILGGFVLFALLAPSVSGVKFRPVPKFALCFVVLLGSGFLAYSRYVWLIYVVSIFTAMVVERSWKMMVVIILAVLILCIPFYDAFQTIFEARFLSEGTEVSDAGRVAQARALMDEVKARPIFGKGIGAHSKAYLSSDTNMYAYEMQWLSLLMQFGIVGETAILLMVAVSARDLMMAKHPAKLWMIFLFVLWLLASWTNPYLTSSFAGGAFGLFMALFYRMRNVHLSASGAPA